MKMNNKVIDYSIRAKINNKMTLIGNTTECELPSIEFASDTVKGAGIMGEIDMPNLFSPGAMSFSIGSRIFTQDNASISAPKAQEFEVRWVTDKFDSASIQVGIESHKAVIKCLPKKSELGKLEAGGAQDPKLEYEVLYYKELLDGKLVTEIDKLNYKFVINGTDYAKNIKSAL